ncbi:serine/threonine protein kinase [Colletotrichum lupini]|uniref:Serine/threonine protein kinase n=1 Tax=Colletotrichum lupini TaxID=145971 RepID=A0A9Q8WM88_9PEZI|nr:serine/threonine protein kinase [Colletotrichum lupini]UQC87830.1 serine/threonine protein kinase [Colletotrichum lupini]
MAAPAFNEQGPAIHIAARGCDDQLRDMIQTTHQGKTALKELQQRFQAWANNSGVFAEQQICLDARLSDHKPPRLIILEMIKLIQRNLETAHFDTARSNTITVQESRLETKLGDRFPGTTVQLSDTEEPGLDLDMRYLNVAFKGVLGALERLNRIAALISKSSKLSRPARLEEFIRRNPQDSETEIVIKGMVSGKFPDIPGLLKTQLIRSMIYRRKRLEYECGRRERLYNTRAEEENASAWHDDGKASTYHQSAFNEGYDAIQLERTTSVSTTTAIGTEIQYPRQPKAEASEDITRKCQFCRKQFPTEQVTRTRWWRHLQSLCYQSISIGVDDENTEDGDIEDEGTEDEGTEDEGSKDEGTKVSDNTEGGVAEGENERSSSDGIDRSSGQGQRNEFRATDVIFHRYGNVRVLQKILLAFGIPKTDINIRATMEMGFELQLPRRLTLVRQAFYSPQTA